MFFKVQKSYLAKITIAWAAMVLLCLSAYLFLLMPQNRKVEEMNRQFSLMDQKVRMSQAASAPEAKSRLQKELETTGDHIREFLIAPDAASSLALNIGRLAGDAGVRGFASKAASDQAWRDIPNCERIGFQLIDVSFESPFNDFAALLSSLERHQPVILIDRFRILQSARPEQGHDVSMTLAVLIKKNGGEFPLNPSLDSSDQHSETSEDWNKPEPPVSVSAKEVATTE